MHGKGATRPQVDRKTPPAVPNYNLVGVPRQAPQAAGARTDSQSDRRDRHDQCDQRDQRDQRSQRAQPVVPNLTGKSSHPALEPHLSGANEPFQHQALPARHFALFPRNDDELDIIPKLLVDVDCVASSNQETEGRRGEPCERPEPDTRRASRYSVRASVREPATSRTAHPQPYIASDPIEGPPPSTQFSVKNMLESNQSSVSVVKPRNAHSNRNVVLEDRPIRQTPAQADTVAPVPSSNFFAPTPGRLPAFSFAGDNDTARPPSIEPDFRGSNDGSSLFAAEQVDRRYQRRKDAPQFFVVGRVFALLWHESAGDPRSKNGGSESAHTTMGRFGQRVFSHIRRMVVVQQRQGYSVCIPINTYGGQGVSKPGLVATERNRHAVIHADDMLPHSSESDDGLMVKKPIAVDMFEPEQKLDRMSRVNFGKPTSVEWSVKVMHVGKVAQSSMANFMGYWRNENNS